MGIYSRPENDGYMGSTRRFFLLKNIVDFRTVLDFGSGPCSLLRWFQSEGISCSYEAYDLREDSLEFFCPCKQHHQAPEGVYDLVCLLGVLSLVRGGDPEGSRNEFRSTLAQAASLSRRYLLVNFSYQDKYPRYIVPHMPDEARCMISDVGFEVLHHDEDRQMAENIFLCIRRP